MEKIPPAPSSGSWARFNQP